MGLSSNVKQGAIYNDEAKRQAAFGWLSERARLRDRGEIRTTQLAWWALSVAIAGIGPGPDLLVISPSTKAGATLTRLFAFCFLNLTHVVA
jgi:hypothetical protein